MFDFHIILQISAKTNDCTHNAFKTWVRKNSAEMRENMGNKIFNATALTIAIIGAINWGLIGIFRFDLVAFILGDMSWLSRIVYILVGLCGLYLISFYMRLSDRSEA